MVLENINLSIEPGEKISFVGFNGAGKTTLIKIMLRLLDPVQGVVEFRGADLREWDIQALRKMFGVVFQDFARFRLTLYENIVLAVIGVGALTQDDLVFGTAALTGVDEIAKAVPRGYDT